MEEIRLEIITATLPERTSTYATSEEILKITGGNQPFEYTAGELKAVVKIKDFWRQHLPDLFRRRKYMATPEGQVFKRHSDLCAKYRSSPKIYIVLLSSAVDVCMKVDSVQVSLQHQHERIMRHIEGADPSEDTYEALDGCLQRVLNLEFELKSQAKRISASSVSKILVSGDLKELRQVLNVVKASTAAAESGLAQLMTEMDNM